MQIDTVFDLASLTKIMGTATLVARLVERGWLTWDTPLAAIWPAFRFPRVTFRHLLSHTAGYVAWQPFWEKLRARAGARPLTDWPIATRQSWMREMILAVDPDVAPGTRALYSDVSFLAAGFGVEALLRMPLDRAIRKYVWEPMGLGLTFRPTDRGLNEARDERCAATEDCPWRGGVVQGQVHDDNTWAMGGYAAHAGAFGTVEDVLRLARALVHARFLSDRVRDEMWTRVSEPAGCERTPGWDTPSGTESSVGHRFSGRTVGHLGFTGTSLWIDREAGLAVTLLTNRVHPSRENQAIRAFRPRFHDAIREDLAAAR